MIVADRLGAIRAPRQRAFAKARLRGPSPAMSNFTFLGSLALVAMTACGPDLVPTRSDDGTTTTDASSSSGAPRPSSTSTSTADSTSTPTTEATGLDEPGVSFVDDADIGINLGCDPYVQDCPPGQKCAWWANDGGGAWNDTRCVPVVDDPAARGEPCTVVESGTSGLDDCEFGAMCWDIDPETLEGYCVEQCSGSEQWPACEDPETTCSIAGDGLALCLPNCNPLHPDDCAEDQGCYPINEDWRCAPDASGKMGAYGDPCEFTNVCSPGLICGHPSFVPDCDSSVGCCTEVCDLDEPECSNMELGVGCTPWWTDSSTAPVGYDDVGVCALPPR
ncbi:MAG: hypothetical protein AAF799_05455 [Myxococcota bacterium]